MPTFDEAIDALPYPPRDDGEMHPDHVRRAMRLAARAGADAAFASAAGVVAMNRDAQNALAEQYRTMPEPTYGDVARGEAARVRAAMLDTILEAIDAQRAVVTTLPGDRPADPATPEGTTT